MQGMPSFSFTMLPSLESATAMVSPVAFFFRNFFSPAGRWRQLCVRRSCPQDQQRAVLTLAQLAVQQGAGCCQGLCGVLKLVKGLELDHLHSQAC